MNVDKSELRRLAGAAISECEAWEPMLGLTCSQNFFAIAANPSAVLALLDELSAGNYRLHEVAAACATAEQERDHLREEVPELRAALAESRANDRTAMGYLADLKQIAGGDDFPSMVRNVEAMAKDARRWQCVRNAVPIQSPYAVWLEGSHPVLGKDADELVDNFLEGHKDG